MPPTGFHTALCDNRRPESAKKSRVSITLGDKRVNVGIWGRGDDMMAAAVVVVVVVVVTVVVLIVRVCGVCGV
jgi:hypothetical protein